MPAADINGTRLHYERAGAGPPLVFVHGMCGGAFVWADQVERLAARFTCITYDRRGHSCSAPSVDQSIAVHAADLGALVGALGLDRPVLVGSSAGGAVVFEALIRHPCLARGALLSEPALFGLDPGPARALFDAIGGAIREPLSHGDPEAALVAFLGVVCPGLWERMDHARRRAYLDNAPMLTRTLDAVGATVTRDDVTRMTLPICLVTGADSVPEGRAISELLVHLLPDARHVELDGAGHATYADAPEAFAEALAAFADEVSVHPQR